MKCKNSVLMVIAIILFAYAGFISIFPMIVVNSFNKNLFTEKMQKAVGLVVTFDKPEVRISPNFETTVKIPNLKIEFPDKQPVLKANNVILKTTPEFLFGKTITIKDLLVSSVKYDDLILPDGTNKIEYIPKSFNPELIGKKGLTIVSGPVRVKYIKASYTKSKPYSYKEESIPDIVKTESETREFLTSLNFRNVIIK